MRSLAAQDPERQNLVPFYLVVIYIFLEFGRPQNLLKFLGKIHLSAFIVILIALFVGLSHRFTLKTKQTFLFVLFLVEMMLHGPFVWNNYWAFMMFYVMSITFIEYCGIIAFVDTYDKFEKLLKYFYVTFIFLSIIGIEWRGKGIGGFIGDENDFCMALNMILPFTIFGLFMDKSKKYKIWCASLMCLYLFVIILTKSRGGFLGLISVVGYCVLKTNKKMIFGMLVVVLGIFMLLFAPSGYWKEIGTIRDEASQESQRMEAQYGTGAQRLYSWKLGWGMFKENPIFGVGQGNYPWHVKDQEEKMNVLWQTRSLGGRAAHSLYFTLLPELGLVGFIIFSLMIYYTLKDLKIIKDISRKSNKKMIGQDKNNYYYALSLEASTIGYLTSSVFISTLYYPNMWLFMGIAVALKNIINKKNNSKDSTNILNIQPRGVTA